jgi:hypothetical protein
MSAIREKLTLKWRRLAGECGSLPAESDEFVECAPVAAAVLVKCIEIQPLQVDPWVESDPLDICLEYWRAWMGRNNQDLGTQRQKLRTDDDERDVEKDSESVAAAAEERREDEIAEGTDAAINDLRACDRWAIYKMCGLSSVWKFPLLDFMQTAQGAKMQIEQKLRENIATRALFG